LAGAKRVLPYVDVPLQHASEKVLRAAIPSLTLRTTLIVGFPGETDEGFAELCEFVRETGFDHLGAFRYSDEEGTAAFEYPDKVPRETARERHAKLISIQAEIMRARLAGQVGEEAVVLIDRAGARTGAGRLPSQAPEIDGGVLVRGAGLRPGAMVPVRITGVSGPDLEAEPLNPSSS
jgi:ribosomal protein S12 methylthiotransferase